MGTSDKTICQVGCLMSSITMGLNAGYTPGTMNKWLTENNGYDNGDDLIWGALLPHGLMF